MKMKSSFSKLMDYAGRHRYLTYASWVLSALSALIALVPFIYIWRIIQEVLEVAPNFYEAEHLAHYGWMAVLFAVISMLVYVAGLMCSHLAAFRIATNIRIDAMHHIVKLPLGFMDHFGSGKMRKIINESSAATETYLAHQLPDRAGALATPVGLLAMLFVFDWRLGLLSLIPVALGFLVMMRMTGAGMQQKMKEYQNALDNMSNEAVEYIRGIPVVKTFGQTVFSFKKFKAAIDYYEKWVTAYATDLRMPMTLYTTAINGVFAFLIAAGLAFTSSGVTNGFLLNLIFYIIITPVISLTLTRIMFQSENKMIVNDALERIESILQMEPLPQVSQSQKPADTSVELRHVSYSYDGTKDALHDVSLKIDAGQTVALVGPSGGGKSTLANVLSRFFDPQSGSVLIGGVNVRDMKKDDLMREISFVFQNSRLIKASIFDNVRLGKPNATKAEVMEALRAAQCEDIIEKLPRGIDTVIGARGIYLSGGEQQRIAIARVILKDAPIIILDEATAFADPDNESRVQEAFNTMSKGKTVIMIAHRLSTIVHADRIFVLQNGIIAESGTHQELMEQNSLYREMWNSYQQSVQWKVQKEA